MNDDIMLDVVQQLFAEEPGTVTSCIIVVEKRLIDDDGEIEETLESRRVGSMTTGLGLLMWAQHAMLGDDE